MIQPRPELCLLIININSYMTMSNNTTISNIPRKPIIFIIIITTIPIITAVIVINTVTSSSSTIIVIIVISLITVIESFLTCAT